MRLFLVVDASGNVMSVKNLVSDVAAGLLEVFSINSLDCFAFV